MTLKKRSPVPKITAARQKISQVRVWNFILFLQYTVFRFGLADNFFLGYLGHLWVWLADHHLDIPGQKQISVYAGSGILSESSGAVWMIGTGRSTIIFFSRFTVSYLKLLCVQPYF
jgi:hypothetical protein